MTIFDALNKVFEMAAKPFEYGWGKGWRDEFANPDGEDFPDSFKRAILDFSDQTEYAPSYFMEAFKKNPDKLADLQKGIALKRSSEAFIGIGLFIALLPFFPKIKHVSESLYYKRYDILLVVGVCLVPFLFLHKVGRGAQARVINEAREEVENMIKTGSSEQHFTDKPTLNQ